MKMAFPDGGEIFQLDLASCQYSSPVDPHPPHGCVNKLLQVG